MLSTAMPPTLTSIAAHLYVRDLEASTDFFTTKLGFTLDFIYGEPPSYPQSSRFPLQLTHVAKR